MITLAQWNVNGWAYKREGNVSGKFRSDVIIETGYDVYAICETHLAGNNGISVPGYTWYGHNRTELNANAIRGSGGVGFLIANHILNDYSVNIIDQSYEGILDTPRLPSLRCIAHVVRMLSTACGILKGQHSPGILRHTTYADIYVL